MSKEQEEQEDRDYLIYLMGVKDSAEDMINTEWIEQGLQVYEKVIR